jgi:predicted enzyme related to lactoylglutathione lyase
LLNYFGQEGAATKDAVGTAGSDHFGIQVDDMAATQALIESAGGSFYFDLGDERKGNFERKFKDPEGTVFDISRHGWLGTDGRDFPGDK